MEVIYILFAVVMMTLFIFSVDKLLTRRAYKKSPPEAKSVTEEIKGETDEAATNVVHFPNIKIDENGERYYIIKINARDIDLQRADELAKLLGDGATRTMALYQALHIIHWAFVVRKADHLLLMREGLFGPERLEGPNAVSWENNAHRKRRQG